jgi:hydrogenase maturation protein HypF
MPGYRAVMRRRRLVFSGIVQGVGFRPAVFRLATALGLTGFVQNRRSAVVAEIQGDEDAVGRFEEEAEAAMPRAARIQAVQAADAPVVPAERGFVIAPSEPDTYVFPPIPPDLPLCPDCTRELLDPRDRRYLYPFITCTQCGPRYSIVERTPFDRENTSMRPFAPCAACAAEYENPADRRFHSQTNSCPACGPRLRFAPGRPQEDPVRAAIDVLRQGGVVAIQGIGGFHLAADPRNPDAVARLRRDKDRVRKPFALMVRDQEEAGRLCVLSGPEERLLCSAEAPIVIAPRRADAPAWLDAVSDTNTLGVMLPYTPLHFLLFHHPGAGIEWRHLVMTSGNRAGEPIVTDPREATEKLSQAVDAFLFHDRKIVFRTDDSVVRVGPSTPAFALRRSRGYVPGLIGLSRPVRGVILATGGDLKSAPALARGSDVHLLPFNGDLDDEEAYRQFEAQILQVLGLYGVSPDLVAHDMHPLYRSTAWAAARPERTVAVQHHFAHALSVMAEHGLEEALALSFDGTGYGTDGAIWGGEFIHATRSGFTRLGSFAPFGLPGGDEAVRHPPRTALALLADVPGIRIPGIKPDEEALLRSMLQRGVNAPQCTSLGRIFDAAAALLGLVEESLYEGEGPIRLEGAALRAAAGSGTGWDPAEAESLLPVRAARIGDGRLFIADPRPLLEKMLAEGAGGAAGQDSIARLALLFHRAVAAASREGARRMKAETGVSRLALSGGVFQNLLLREILVPPLIKEGFEVFLNQKAPPGDGGLSVGQAWFEERQG